ncbi:TraR/DksA family transcriptional regulator [Sphaerimonospora mesophila]|uniref:TraR/DksA family transcriptional regulator n=1 Tax=Sphaerimonospora mesophila TaxID=37483 RepID=UPI0006E205DC
MTTSDEFTGISDVQMRLIREELEEQLSRRNTQLRDLRSAVDGGGGEAVARLDALAEIAATERAISEISKSLARMDDGSYGTCADCGTEIPFNRLKIRPLTRYCITCQRRHETR